MHQPYQKLQLEENNTVNKFLKGVSIGSKKIAHDYKVRLGYFGDFIAQNYDLTLDELIEMLTMQGRGPKIDIYDMFSDYVSYIQKEKNVSPITIKMLISAAKCYLETFDVEISPRKFKFKVRLPRVIRAEKEPLSKEDMQIILMHVIT